MKPVFWIVACAVSLLMLTSCGRKNSACDTRNEMGYLRLNLQGEPRSLDPRRGDRRSQIVLRMLFEGLTRVLPDNSIQLAAAESVTVDADKCTYTFNLRQAFWSNGLPVVAADFERTWKEMCAPDFDSPFANAFFCIKNAEAAKRGSVSISEVGVIAVDERTLVVELEHPAPYFLNFVSSPLFSPTCQALVQTHPNWSREAGDFYVSNGPFSLEAWRHGEEISVKKNPYYWDSETVRLAGIKLSMVEDAATVLEMFSKGQLDWAGEPLSEVPLDALDRLRDQGMLRTCNAGGIFHLKFDVLQSPLDSPAMRRALAYAIDRRELIDHVMRGGETIATSILPPSLTLEGGTVPDGDRALAREQLQEVLRQRDCKLEDLPPLKFTYALVEGHKALAQAIQQQWQDNLGIRVELQGMDWNSFFATMIKGEVQIGGAAWYSWHDDPIYNLEHVKSRSARYNSTHWEHPNYCALLDAADREIDLEKRAELLRQAEQLVLEELPLVPLYVTTYKYVVSDRVRDVFIGELGHIDFKWARLELTTTATS